MSRIGKQRLCMVSRNHEIRQLVSKERTGYQQRQSNQPCRATTHCSAVPVRIATSHHMHVITGWQQSPRPSPAMVTSRESSRRAQHNPKGRSQPCSPCVDCDKLRSAVVQCHTVELLEAANAGAVFHQRRPQRFVAISGRTHDPDPSNDNSARISHAESLADAPALPPHV